MIWTPNSLQTCRMIVRMRSCKAPSSTPICILAGDFDIGGAEAAQTIGAFPAEQRADDKILPGLQDERSMRPFAGRMAQMAEEIDGMEGGRAVPDQAPLLP